MNILKNIGAALIRLGVKLGGQQPERVIQAAVHPDVYVQLEQLAPIGCSGNLDPCNAAFMAGQQHILKAIRQKFMVK